MSRKRQRVFWGKINQRRGSQFLDTVCEAAWGLHFINRVIQFEYEAALDPANKKGPDADFRIGPSNAGLWLDVCSEPVA